jgi:hypothetical protein
MISDIRKVKDGGQSKDFPISLMRSIIRKNFIRRLATVHQMNSRRHYLIRRITRYLARLS